MFTRSARPTAPPAPPPESLHGAKIGGRGDLPADNPVPHPVCITELLNRIGQGFRDDAGKDFDKLAIARNYGPALLQLKAAVPHGDFMATLRERYPAVSYAKCNRWMYLARQHVTVESALRAYPGVCWGPKTMYDYLKGAWSPEEGLGRDDEAGSDNDMSRKNADPS